jgi:predicted PurR-regulated permease PerM
MKGVHVTNAAHRDDPHVPDPSRADIGPLPAFMRPLVDRVARVRATVHTKLLAGFLLIALLLLSMGVLSVAVLARINGQVETLTTLNEQTNRAQQMIY